MENQRGRHTSPRRWDWIVATLNLKRNIWTLSYMVGKIKIKNLEQVVLQVRFLEVKWLSERYANLNFWLAITNCLTKGLYDQSVKSTFGILF